MENGKNIFSLPYELVVEILSHLTIPELLNTSLVSRQLLYATQEPVLWLRFFDTQTGLRLKPDARRSMVAVRTPPGVWDSDNWVSGASSTSPTLSVKGLPHWIKSRVEQLIWPGKPVVSILQPSEELGEGQIPVHIPTLLRSRDFIEAEMRLQGRHRRYDPSKPLAGRVAEEPDSDEEVVEVDGPPAIYPHHLWLLSEHTAKVYVTRVQGNWLLSGSRDAMFRIWRIPSLPLDGSIPEYGPECVHTQLAHDKSIVALEFEVDRGLVVTGSSDHTAKIWKVDWGRGDDKSWDGVTVTLVNTLSRHTKTVSGVAITKENVVTCSHDGHVHVYDRSTIMSDPVLLHDVTFPEEEGYPAGLALSPLHSKVLVAGFQRFVILELSTGTHISDVRRGSLITVAWDAGWCVGATEKGIVAVGGNTTEASDEWVTNYIATSPSRGGLVRAVKVVPELDLFYCATHKGVLWPWNDDDDDDTSPEYRFQDEPIFSLDRSGVFLCAAVGSNVAVITYGVGKPYASLFA